MSESLIRKVQDYKGREGFAVFYEKGNVQYRTLQTQYIGEAIGWQSVIDQFGYTMAGRQMAVESGL